MVYGTNVMAGKSTRGRTTKADSPDGEYVLEEAIGFVLRQANQRHATIFSALIGDGLTPTQWAALCKLAQMESCTQNLLGRLTAMDAPTIKGVVERLSQRGFVTTQPDPDHGRRMLVMPTAEGKAAYRRNVAKAWAVTEETLRPLSAADRKRLCGLLKRLV
jgi:DNA-binding MarR family transcriptional regulator